MSRFEDEIKKKLQDNNWNTEATGWEAMQLKLDAQPPLSDFEQKVNETIESKTVEYNDAHWENFTNNHNNLNSFEKALASKVNSGSASKADQHWSAIQNALNDARLTPLEKAFKRILSSGNTSYNPANWSALEKSLNAAKNRKIFFRAAASLLLLMGIGVGVNEYSNTTSKHTVSSFVNIETLDKEPFITESTKTNSNKNLRAHNNSGSTSDKYDKQSGLDNSIAGRIFDESTNFDEKTVLPQKGLNDGSLINKRSSEIIASNENVESINIAPLTPELCSPLEFVPQKIKTKTPSEQTANLHPAATVWFNIWDNPVFTGYFGKSYASLNYQNNWSWSDQNNDLKGQFSLNQPLNYIASYEHKITNKLSLGGFIEYALNNNWNHRTINVSASYGEEVFEGTMLKVGASATLNNNNIAVNRLTLREQALNSNFIFTTELGSIKAEQSYDINYDVGALLENKWFYVAYLGENIVNRDLTGQQEYLQAHQVQVALHAPALGKLKSSAMLQYRKDLFHQYSPALGLTYDEKYFVFAEYSDLNNSNLTLGYLYKNKLRLQGTFSLNHLNEQNNNQQLNLNYFQERQGFINLRLNYLIK